MQKKRARAPKGGVESSSSSSSAARPPSHGAVCTPPMEPALSNATSFAPPGMPPPSAPADDDDDQMWTLIIAFTVMLLILGVASCGLYLKLKKCKECDTEDVSRTDESKRGLTGAGAVTRRRSPAPVERTLMRAMQDGT